LFKPGAASFPELGKVVAGTCRGVPVRAGKEKNRDSFAYFATLKTFNSVT
jgi:hypothetical protein